MQVLNFGHPLTADVLEAIADSPHVEERISGIRDIKAQVSNDEGFGPQATALVESIGWSGLQWQANPFALVLPGLAPLAAAVLAEVHGRCGYFPSIIRLKPVQGATPPRFAFAEVVSLSQIREQARTRR